MKAMQEPPAESAPHNEGEAPRQLPRESVSLESVAWLRHGMFGGSDRGMLTAREGRVNFATVFEADRHEIRVSWPWWEFGAGVHLAVSGKIYRLSFIRPNDDASTSSGSMGEARAAGKAWKAYFGAEKAG
jgi:hypothetical protein